MADFRRNGLYYESKDIRNSVLKRNIGEYAGYEQSFLFNGGLAVGMPYAVETEYVPYTLDERSQISSTPGQKGSTGKKHNANVPPFLREGGLFGYTHEVINSDQDPISRNINLPETYYDYDSTEENFERLARFSHSYSWGEEGLHTYSATNHPEGTPFFDDYRDYVNSLFSDGLSFQKKLGEGYGNSRLLTDGFDREIDIENGPQRFIDEWSGYFTDDLEAERLVEDTKLGYVGRTLANEQKLKQVVGIDLRYQDYFHQPITYGRDFVHGLMSGNEYDYRVGISALNPTKTDMMNFIVDARDVLDDNLDYTFESFQDDMLRKHLRFQRHGNGARRYNNFSAGEGYERNTYADYYNIRTYGSTSYISDYDDNGNEIPGAPVTNQYTVGTPSALGESVEGFFEEAGIFDANVVANEHYDEQDGLNSGERDLMSRKGSYNEPENLGLKNDIGFSSRDYSLLEKTKRLFAEHKIKTLVGRFHTSDDDEGAKMSSLTQTATNKTYGMSHGRNLLKLNPTVENGYDNPYCRVWTYHHQYSKMTDLIRPFVDEHDNFIPIEDLQKNFPGRPIILRPSGTKGWSEKTVLNRNGMVNIAPSNRDANSRVETKKCMFSIENLAWKGVKKDNLMAEGFEVGPLGGRIMWFPPYNLSFNESVNVSWGANDFIGRGEKIYSYTNTERTGTISFTILADYPSILGYWMREKYMKTTDLNDDDAEKEEGDQAVLRFFAGCGDGDTLKVDLENLLKNDGLTLPMVDKTGRNGPKTNGDKTTDKPDETQDPEQKPERPAEFTKENSISFYVYYPNNLSCMDFMDEPKIGVNYLVNGKNGFDYTLTKKEGNEYRFEPNGLGQYPFERTCKNPKNENKPAKKYYALVDCNGFGYEMGHKGSFTGITDQSASAKVDEKDVNNSAADKGNDYYWGYGVDHDTIFQRLCGPHGKYGDKSNVLYPNNYKDMTDFGLNCTPNFHDPACEYSFLDVVMALTPSSTNGGFDYEDLALHYDKEKVKKIKEILGIDGSSDNGDVENKKNRKFYFGIAGGASVHGYETLNTGLSLKRANFLAAWLEYCFKRLNMTIDYDKDANIPIQTGIQGGEESLEINSESAKRGRYAKATIFWYDEDIKDEKDSVTYVNTSGEPSDTQTITEAVKPYGDKSTDKIEVGETATVTTQMSVKDYYSSRYNNEELFFKVLKESDNVLYKRITDKVKFFDPAFHSITPEGFNARLAFLHQCTRQGPTISSSDLSNNGYNEAGYAGNLSFGRPPVCVLRLGDFFNTRIIINSVSIQYETNQWDLNPEGIGVQPMLANVTLGIVFQGGSSLGGPIQRLQNAVSFNYYANQEVYDDRADSAVYDDKGNLKDETYVWVAGYGGYDLGTIKKMFKSVDKDEEDAKPANKVAEDEFKVSETTRTALNQKLENARATNNNNGQQ